MLWANTDMARPPHDALDHIAGTHQNAPTRRAFLLGGAAALLAGCAQTGAHRRALDQSLSGFAGAGISDDDPDVIYASVMDGDTVLPAINYRKLRPAYYRQHVRDTLGAPPGTIVIKLADRQLFLIGQEGAAIRYGIGIGRDGFAWAGRGVVNHQAAWPGWTPTAAMIGRDPALASFSGGMKGGLGNPLGARALYIYSGGIDTLYRIHGTPEWWTIGQAMSSGCIRMINQDVIHLAARISPGNRVWVA